MSRIMAPQRYPVLPPGTGEYVTLHDKGTWQIRIRTLRWGRYPGFFRWAQCNAQGPQERKRAGRKVREKSEDAILPTLKTEEGTRAKEWRRLLGAGMVSPLQPSEATQPC